MCQTLKKKGLTVHGRRAALPARIASGGISEVAKSRTRRSNLACACSTSNSVTASLYPECTQPSACQARAAAEPGCRVTLSRIWNRQPNRSTLGSPDRTGFKNGGVMNLKLRKIAICLVLVLQCGACMNVSAQMNGKAARDWSVVFRDSLQHSVLQFWIEHALDKEFGGLLGRLNRQGEPIGSGNKSVVLISRSLWSFSEAYRRYPDPADQKMAGECLKFLGGKMVAQ